MNGGGVDSVTNIGLTSTFKGYLSFSDSERVNLQNARWFPKEIFQQIQRKSMFVFH